MAFRRLNKSTPIIWIVLLSFCCCYHFASAAFVNHHHRVKGAVSPSRTHGGVKGKVTARREAVVLKAAKKKVASKKVKKKKAAKKKAAAKVPVETFKKADFITAVSEKTGFSKSESSLALQSVLDTITEQLSLGKKISLVGFGSFQVKDRAARKGRNPQTGEEIQIKASKSASFTSSKNLKELLNE